MEIITGPNQHFVFSTDFHPEVPRGHVGFSLPQRKWATLSINQDIEVVPYKFHQTSRPDCLSQMVLEVDFFQKKTQSAEAYDSDLMGKEFLRQFANKPFTEGQQLVFNFDEKKKLLGVVVKSLEAVDIKAYTSGEKVKPQQVRMGLLSPHTQVQFIKNDASALNLVIKG